jgi:hypothetical protein
LNYQVKKTAIKSENASCSEVASCVLSLKDRSVSTE